MRALVDRVDDLTSVVTDHDFARALVLLSQPEFAASTWDWLRGGQPDRTLLTAV